MGFLISITLPGFPSLPAGSVNVNFVTVLPPSFLSSPSMVNPAFSKFASCFFPRPLNLHLILIESEQILAPAWMPLIFAFRTCIDLASTAAS
ncbi:hypothetical protein D3C85_1626250 [compost metagenome]